MFYLSETFLWSVSTLWTTVLDSLMKFKHYFTLQYVVHGWEHEDCFQYCIWKDHTCLRKRKDHTCLRKRENILVQGEADNVLSCVSCREFKMVWFETGIRISGKTLVSVHCRKLSFSVTAAVGTGFLGSLKVFESLGKMIYYFHGLESREKWLNFNWGFWKLVNFNFSSQSDKPVIFWLTF